MVSSGGICEIVEANDEPSTSRRLQTFNQVKGQDREKRPPIVRKAPNKSLHDDINKLFESVNLRATKSLDLSDSWRNASKRPMRGTGSQSPGIGFSEPVTLKQALRGMCISQAAEMAVVKRLSMTSASPSPRISEVGKITNLHRTEKSLMMEESTSYDSEAFSRGHQDSVKKSATQSSYPPPSFSCKSNLKNIKCIPSESGCEDNVGMSRVEGKHFQEPAIKSPKQNPAALVIRDVEPSPSQSDAAPAVKVDLETVCSDTTCQNVSKPEKKNPGSHRLASCPGKDYVTVHKAAPKVRRKSRLQTVTSAGTVKSGKDNKSTKSTFRAVKTATRNKNLVVKKSKKVAASVDDNHNVPHEGSGLGQSQLICQRCQCSLMDTEDDSNKSLSATTIAEVLTDGRKSDSSKPVSIPVVETNINSKSCEKGDISQSSKSSNFDFSSSTTSLSEDSNLSGSTFGNRPHMSKDMRWGGISRIRKQHGFLGLSHFNLLKKLGSGDIGTVYLAELIGTNCLYAIKVMDNEFLATRKKMPRAQTEREILRMLDHPFLPTLYAQFTSENLSCLVMEFCPGGDLHVLRQKQPGQYFPEEAARFYVAEVLLALEYLHMLGIVYRDLKPENILVREDGHIMLTDFDLSLRCSVNPMLVKSSSLMTEPPRVSGPCAGSNCIDPFCTGPSCKMSCFTPRLLPARKLKADAAAQARSLHHLVAEPTEARSNSFVGTHEYLAPEIIKGEGHGSAVDWWTFGVFLYELLYGKTPFKGAGNEETLGNVVLQNLKFPDTPIVSFQARDLIRGLLAKDPLNRLGTQTGAAEIKRHPFFEGLNWALIRCAVPPQIPEFYEVVDSQMGESQEKLNFVEYSGDGEHLEFQLF